MTWRLRFLNEWLRRTERPRLATSDPQSLRRSLEARARVLFVPPMGTTCAPMDLDRVPALRITGRGAQGAGVIYYVHGGAFVFGSPNVYRAMLGRLSELTGMQAVLPEYRKAPEHPFPAAPDDVRAGWEALIASGVDPSDIVLGGDSAGGNLALVLLSELIAEGAGLPRAAFTLSPLTDMTYSSASVAENAATDVILPAERSGELQQMYLQGHDPGDPRVSPLRAKFDGAPPVYIAVSTVEMLRDDGLRMADRLKAADVHVTVELGENLPHVWPMFRPMIPQADATLRNIAGWISRVPVPKA